MRGRLLLIPLMLVVFLGGLLGAPAHADHVTRLTTTLSWQNEVDTGSDHGFGWAAVRLTGDSVCFGLRWSDIEDVESAHIHEGQAGESGPVVVTLFMEGPGPNSSSSSAWGCVRGQDPAVVAEIAMHPEDYYVNVHTAAVPAGAIRGQLQAATS